MIQFQMNVAEKLKEKGYNSYVLLKSNLLSQGTITKLNRPAEKIDLNLSLKTLDIICQLLDCNIEDVVKIVPDEEMRKKKEETKN